MQTPKITVLMTVYNGEKYLREAIDSILNQTFTDFELLIINDGSTDNTPEILRSYDDPRIEIVRNFENLGRPKSLNIGLGLAKGEYIAIMDADDISFPDRFTKEVNYLDNNPDVAMVGTGRENIDENGKLIDVFIPPKIVSVERLLKANPFQHSSVIFRKEIIIEAGNYCNLMQGTEDFYLWLKLIRNHHLHNIPEVLGKYRIYKNSLTYKKVHEGALSHIFAIRIFENVMKESDICFNMNPINLSKDERKYYLNHWALFHRMNDNFKEARKIYLKIFFMNPTDFISITNYFRLFLGKKVVSETTKLWCNIKKRYF
jgi:glycosyltransferase involved in cell wall biosynthesis